MLWAENKVVSPHDLDMNNILSATGALRLLQDAAYSHMYYNPPSMDQLRAEGKVFLLSRINMNLYAPVNVCEKLVSETCACDSKGFSFIRYSRLKRGDEIVAELTAIWALVDAETKQLLRVSEYPQSYESLSLPGLEPPSRIRIPRDAEMTLRGEYRVSYNDVDINKHVNNTKYPDILCGFLPSMEGKRIIKINLSYVHEAPLGESIKVYSMPGEEDDSYLFRTVREDGQTNVEAYVVLDSID